MIAVADRRLVLPPNLAVPLTPWIVLAKSAVPASCPVDVTEDVLATISIPAGAIGPNGVLRIYTSWTMTNSVNNKTLRARFSGGAGTSFMGLVFTTTATYDGLLLIANRGAANSQVGQPSAMQASNTGLGSGTSARTTAAVDTTAATSLVISGQKALNSETLTLESYLIELAYGA